MNAISKRLPLNAAGIVPSRVIQPFDIFPLSEGHKIAIAGRRGFASGEGCDTRDASDRAFVRYA